MILIQNERGLVCGGCKNLVNRIVGLYEANNTISEIVANITDFCIASNLFAEEVCTGAVENYAVGF